MDTISITSGTLTVDVSSANVGVLNMANSTGLVLAGHNLTVGALSTTGNGTGVNITNGTASTTSTLTINGSTSQTFAGVIGNGASGTVALTVSGTGTQTLRGVNTYTGATTISSGVLSISADNNLGTAPGSATANSLIINGGTLAATASFTLNANRGIAVGSSTSAAIGVASGFTMTYTGIIANVTGQTGALTKVDSGTLILGGASSFTGAYDDQQRHTATRAALAAQLHGHFRNHGLLRQRLSSTTWRLRAGTTTPPSIRRPC